MAIEIVQRGKGVTDLFELTCRKDETIIRCNKADLKYNSDQRDGDYFSWKCPVCGHDNTIATGFLTAYAVKDAGEQKQLINE